MTPKRNDGTPKQTPPRKTRRTRIKSTTDLIRSTEHRDAYNERIKELEQRRQKDGNRNQSS